MTPKFEFRTLMAVIIIAGGAIIYSTIKLYLTLK